MEPLTREQHQKIETEFSKLMSRVTDYDVTAGITSDDDKSINFSLTFGDKLKRSATTQNGW